MRIVGYALALLLLLSSAAFADSVMINHKEAKIRSGPGTTYTVLWRPRLYTPFEVLAKYERWYAVRDVEGDVGWIHDSVTTKDAAAIVTGDLINVYESADTNSRILYQAPRNYTFKVKDKKGGWLHVVDPDNDEGWIAAKEVWAGDKQAEKAEEPAKKSKKKSSKQPKADKKKK